MLHNLCHRFAIGSTARQQERAKQCHPVKTCSPNRGCNEFYVMDVIVNRRSAPLTAPLGGCHARRNARLSSSTTAMDNSDITDEGLGRLSLVPRLEGRQFWPPSKIARNPKSWADCPRFRTDIAVGNVRFPAELFSSTTSKLPFPQPPTPVDWMTLFGPLLLPGR
jgi:hypothetical protein